MEETRSPIMDGSESETRRTVFALVAVGLVLAIACCVATNAEPARVNTANTRSLAPPAPPTPKSATRMVGASGGAIDPEAIGGPDDSKVWLYAREYVSQSLKAPGTARWSDDYTVTRKGKGVCEVRAWVDAQNSFGALIRRDFVCRLRIESGGGLSLLSISGL